MISHAEDGATGPLDGVRVAAFTGYLLGPVACQYLADMGASVVKIENPGGGGFERNWSGAQTWVNGVSALFMLAHRNVRSVAVDLKSAEGQDIARQLATGADVVIANFKPGVLERFGLGADQLLAENERLIYASASGFGRSESMRDLPGQDLLIQAQSGLMAVTGNTDSGPMAAGAAIVDQHGGALLAMGVLGALHRRTATGRGGQVEITMLHTALDLQLEPFTYHANGGRLERPEVPLASTYHPAPYGVYPVSDGHVVVSLASIDLLSAALGRPASLEAHLSEGAEFREREAIYRSLAEILVTETRDGAVARLRSSGVWCSQVNDYGQLMEDPVFVELGPVEHIEHPEAGRVTLVRPPVMFDGSYLPTRSAPPRLGEHTWQCLRELGLTDEQIHELAAAGHVYAQTGSTST